MSELAPDERIAKAKVKMGEVGLKDNHADATLLAALLGGGNGAHAEARGLLDLRIHQELQAALGALTSATSALVESNNEHARATRTLVESSNEHTATMSKLGRKQSLLTLVLVGFAGLQIVVVAFGYLFPPPPPSVNVEVPPLQPPAINVEVPAPVVQIVPQAPEPIAGEPTPPPAE